jgi:pimeloyl-ACP methyl ester carboxylesterase
MDEFILDGLGVVGFVEIIVRNWALVSILGTIALLIVIPTAVLRKYVGIIVNMFQDTPIPLSMDVRDYPRLEGEQVEFCAFDGHRLLGRFYTSNPDRPVRGMIIFAHELNSDGASAVRYCRGLLDAGYEVFAFDFRGQGRSVAEDGYKSRLWPSDREQSDLLGAIAYVGDWLEQQGRPREIGLVGVSRGAGAAILAAVNVPSVKAIMVDGGFSTDAYLEYLMQRWVSIFAKVRLVYENHPVAFWRFLRWLSVRKVGKVLRCRFPSVRKAVTRLGRMPIFIIHGEKDGLIPVSQAQMLYALAEGPKYLWICPGAKHNQAVAAQPKAYAEYSVGFFDQYLAKVRPAGGINGEGLLSHLAQPLSEPVRVSYARYTKPARIGRRGRKAARGGR